MHKFNSDSPITRFTFNFFDRHTAFKHLAHEVGDNSFLSPGEVAFLVVGYCHSLIGVLKRKYSEPELTILSRQELSSPSARIKYIFGDIENFQTHDIKSTYTLHMAAPSASETFRSMDELKNSTFWQREPKIC